MVRCKKPSVVVQPRTVHSSYEPNIKLVREIDVEVVTFADNDNMTGANSARPLFTITPRLVELCTKMDGVVCEYDKRTESQLFLYNMEVDQEARDNVGAELEE